jgi:ADP-heptose:LPS heptosyltransferase
MTAAAPRILVIKLSAFGDFILALGLFERLRRHHANAHICLITTAPFRAMAEQSGLFDEVRTIARWKTLDIAPWLAYRRDMHQRPFDMVYDLQANDRTRMLRFLSPRRMRRAWLAFRRPHPLPDARMLDIAPHMGALPERLDWLTAGAAAFDIQKPYVLLVPGSAPQHPAKRWPAPQYRALAQKLLSQRITPVLIGTAAEAEATHEIARDLDGIIDLTGRTQVADIAALAQGAVAAVGNDTGPMHLISVARCPVVSLFSHASDPARSAPRGPVVRVLRRAHLADLDVDSVWRELSPLLENQDG